MHKYSDSSNFFKADSKQSQRPPTPYDKANHKKETQCKERKLAWLESSESWHDSKLFQVNEDIIYFDRQQVDENEEELQKMQAARYSARINSTPTSIIYDHEDRISKQSEPEDNNVYSFTNN